MNIKDSVSGSNYDSRLMGHGSEWQLALHIRVLMMPVSVRKAATLRIRGHDEAIVPWDPGEWEEWRIRFLTSMSDAWSGQFWLVPQVEFSTDQRELAELQSVRCTLWLESVLDHEHLQVECHKLAPQNDFMVSHKKNGELVLDHRDLTPMVKDCDPVGASIPSPFTAAVHEVGHFLGLEHVAKGTSNPYGNTLEECSDIMGSGGEFNRWHARPWLERIEKHIQGACIMWEASMTPIEDSHTSNPPRRRRHRRDYGYCDMDPGS